jgi:dihydropteroate synthase
MRLQCGTHLLDLARPVVMGVLNVTPDSFSDGGRYFDVPRALDRAGQMAADGAAVIDVGGESTRPGSAPVDEDEELRRVLPVVERLAATLSIPVSIDTRKPAVMRRAIAAGASMVNDVTALRAPGAIEAVAESGAAVCLVHMQGEPGTMQDAPAYADVVGEVRVFLRARAAACEAAGIARSRLVVDPGFGFGKALEHNLALLAGVPALAELGRPVLIGVSRKSMFRRLLGREVDERMPASLAAGLAAVARGAAVLRAHDVRETADALRVWTAVERGAPS